MTRLGIDFGTTHTVVALVDRGNYPTVAFGDRDALPSHIAACDRDGALCYGAQAAARAGEPGWHLLRSFKRLLNSAGPRTTVVLGERSYLLADLLAGFLGHLRDELFSASNAGVRRRETIEAAVSVPANALGGQRFLTVDAFQRAGFEVRRVLNEPSAAACEYAHRHSRTLTSKREHIVVYDLGGGTFDASLLHLAGLTHEVLASAGVSRLGGDDFDEAILEAVLDAAGLEPPAPPEREALLDECRRRKETVTPAARRFIVDLEPFGRPPLTLPVEAVYDACLPLVDRTLEAMHAILAGLRDGSTAGVSWDEVAGIYTVGGASDFPPVYRRLRELFGEHRVRRSPHPFAATAIGLAIALDAEAGFELSEPISRTFGVWRESDDGRGVVFDAIFAKDCAQSGGASPLEVRRRYRPAHDVGHYRFVECEQLRDGVPAGDLLPWGEIRFPFVAELRGRADLRAHPVARLAAPGPEVEERYRYTRDGLIEVTIADLESGYTRRYRMPGREGA